MNQHITIRKGLKLDLGGKPEQSINDSPEIQHVALLGKDYPGLKPRLLVSEGDRVEHGQALFVDKRDPGVCYCSPGKGVVKAIHRGPRRVLDSVVVGLDSPGKAGEPAENVPSNGKQTPERPQLIKQLLNSGLWTSFRTRPFSRVPHSESRPGAIFVTAIDTRPLAADPGVVIQADSAAFFTGLRLIPLLTDGTIYLCTGSDWTIETPAIEHLEQVRFSGPHPAGLPGTHIHHLYPVGLQRVAWQIDYQDVIAIGRLSTTGKLPSSRVVALGGHGLKKPRLVKTRLGASVRDLLQGQIDEENNYRVVSGSVLDGHDAAGNHAFLGRYHNQVSVIPEGGQRRLFGWSGGHGKHRWSTSQHGRFSGMIPLPVFETVVPMDILPAALFRALLVKDTDQAQALGCLELDEEDLALCSYLCPAKTDYGGALRSNLDLIERHG